MSKNEIITRRLTIVFNDRDMTRLNIIIDVSAKFSDRETELMAESQLRDSGYLRVHGCLKGSIICIPKKFYRFIYVHSLEELDREEIIS